MQNDLGQILITREQIRKRVEELADEISRTYGEDSKGLVIVPVLAGSFCMGAL
jgi:hypoxanthine-guanine phosphoribosyltransferase